MADLRISVGDRTRAGSPRKSARLAQNPDRNQGRRDRSRPGWALLGLIAACAPAALIPVKIEAAVKVRPIERWVDAHAPEGGDGTSALPFKRLTGVLAPNLTVHLRSGLYAGPFELPPGIHLVGHGEVVLFAEGETTVVTATSATFEGLSLQGGFIGLNASGPVTLRRVHLSGHRRVAVTTRSELTIEDSVLEGTVSETRGVVLSAGAKGVLNRVRFTGAFRRAVDAEDAVLEATELVSDGPVEALHLARTQALVRKLTVSGGRGPGIFAVEGALTLSDATVNGHEYGLEAKKTALTVEGFTSRKAEFAGIAALQCTGTLRHVSTEDSGSYGGLQLLESALTVEGLKVKRGASTGVLVRLGTVTLDDATIEQIRPDHGPGGDDGGDGLHVRDAEVTVKNLTVRDVEGLGVFASAAARVKIQLLRCERCKVGSVLAERIATVSVHGLISRGGQGPAIAVPDRASIVVEDADITSSEAAIWAECSQGAQVTVRRLKSNLPQPPSPCIERGE